MTAKPSPRYIVLSCHKSVSGGYVVTYRNEDNRPRVVYSDHRLSEGEEFTIEAAEAVRCPGLRPIGNAAANVVSRLAEKMGERS